MLKCCYMCGCSFQATEPFWLNLKISRPSLLNMIIIVIIQGKSQEEIHFHFVSHVFFTLKMICGLEYGHKMRMHFAIREDNEGLCQHLYSKSDVGVRNEPDISFPYFYGLL